MPIEKKKSDTVRFNSTEITTNMKVHANSIINEQQKSNIATLSGYRLTSATNIRTIEQQVTPAECQQESNFQVPEGKLSKGGNGFGIRFTHITGDTRDTMAGMSSANDSNLITDRVSGDEQVPFNPLRFSSSQFSESVLGSARETMDEQGSMSQRNKIPNQEYKQSVITHQVEKPQKNQDL